MEAAPEYLAREALLEAEARFSRAEVARELDTDEKTLGRWVDGRIPRPRLVLHAITNLLRQVSGRIADAPPSDFAFVDLFAGIGGTRLGFERAGGQCVFTSEYDRFCNETYRKNFVSAHEIAGDICPIASDPRAIEQRIPEHDVLVAGFPCQPFSIAGVSKKNALGRAHGFACETQGTLFFDICRILEARKPPAFLLENVRNLKSHDQGRTFEVIMRALHELGYWVPAPRIIDAKPWVPQHRERILIVGFREPTAFSFDMVKVPDARPTLGDVLHPEDGTEHPDDRYTFGRKAKVHAKYTLTDHLWGYLQAYAKKHKAAGNGFGFSCVNKREVARTLSARYYKDGSEILVSRGKGKNPRRLTPRECARLMGFPENFVIPVSDTQAYKQFGNSVVVPVIEAVAKAMKPYVVALKNQERSQLQMVV